MVRQASQIESVVNQLCQPLLKGGVIDFAQNISTWIPYQVVTAIVGVEHENVDRFREAALGWAHAYGVSNTPEQRAYYDQQTGTLLKELRRMCIERKADPQA